jgi:zinc/manganese transport system substrate-binding protein
MKSILFALCLFCLFPLISLAKLQIATTTTDLAAVVKQVGQNQVDVFSIAKGTQDPHQIEAKPSYMVKLRTANLVIAHGLELESAWILPLIQGARNPKLTAKDGLYEIAAELDPIEIPKGDVSRAEGDVHPGGNPHFQLDPIRLGKAAILIAHRLAELDPSQKEFFETNAQAFQKHMNEKTKEWQTRIKKTGVKEIVTYHKQFSYFCDRFEIRCDVQLEPKPGIPPTTSHLLEVISQMKARKIHLVFIENIYDDSVAPKLKQEIPGVVVERIPVSVEGDPGITTNEQLIENLVKTIEQGSH